MTDKIVTVSGKCANCHWNGQVRKFKGHIYCVSGPNRCWRSRRLINARFEKDAYYKGVEGMKPR